MNVIRPERFKSFSIRHLWREESLGNALIIVPMATVVFGYVLLGNTFAKSGLAVELPTSLGGIKHQLPKLFPFEALLLWLTAWTGGSLIYRALRKGPTSAGAPIQTLVKDPLFGMIAVVIAFGMFRLTWDFRENPILGVRNSSFVWYLVLPLLLAVSRISVGALEVVCIAASSMVFARFFLTATLNAFISPGSIGWVVEFSVLPAFAAAVYVSIPHRPSRLLNLRRLALLLVIVSIAAPFGAQIPFTIQRTNLVGVIVSAVILLVWVKDRRKQIATRLVLFLGVVAVVWGAWTYFLTHYETKYGRQTMNEIIARKPWSKGEADENGLEVFRMRMWMDALGLFAENPLVGAGFQKSVVYRIYWGGGKFRPNDGNYVGKDLPPVSGPHCSYINALARMGILGSVFLLIHGITLHRLWLHGYFFAFFSGLGQVVYACFNVGLESPVRSTLLLIAVAMALLLGPRKWSA